MNTDSLKRDLDAYKKEDSILVNKMFNYAYSIKKADPIKATAVFQKAIGITSKINWYKSLPFLYLQIGNIQSLDEKYDEAIGNYLTAQKIAEDNHITTAFYPIHFNLSEAYRLLNNVELTALHAQKALSFAYQEKNDYDILSGLFIVAGSYYMKNRWDSTSYFLDTTLKLAISLNDEYMQQQINDVIADHKIKEKDYRGALNIFKKSLQFQYNTENKNGIAYVYAVLAKIYADLKIKDSAYIHADSALAISINYKLTKEIKDAYEAKFYCYNQFGDYQNALKYKLLYDSIYIATFNVAAGQKAERARMELDQAKKDAQVKADNLRKEAKDTQTRNLLIGGIGTFALTCLFLLWSNRQKQKAKSMIEKAYTDLKSTQVQLIHSEKMASLGELTAGIAHEIQNPLNFVNNFSEVSNELIDEMNEELDKGDIEEAKAIASDVKQNLEKINHHGKRAGDIVKGMLQHSRSSTGQKEPTDFNALCDEYLRLAYHGLRAKDKSFNAKFETEFDTSLPKINIVPQDIGRVILNLINNAFYAVNEKSRQNIEGYEPTVTVSTKKDGDKLSISVKDNGNGIPEKIKDKIFQPFFTTKPTGQGTGLGLSLSYDIVKAHGGEIKVISKEDKGLPAGLAGTEFIILLPVT